MATSASRRRTGGLIGKHRAILAGALAVFARDGYTRASIDAIAAAAGVSSRTIYNHFDDKEELFRTVIQQSAAEVAEVQVEIIDEHLMKVGAGADIEDDLVAFGVAWTRRRPEHEDHSALVRQINAELHHIPAETVETWQRVGPRRVNRALAYHMRRLADRGLLRTDDPDRMALHFSLLITISNLSLPPSSGRDDEIVATVRAGVRSFLDGNRARSQAVQP